MSGRLAVAGEALIDLVPRPDGALAPLVGGGPLNAARAAGRLGQPTAFLGCVSNDGFGRSIAEALAGDGVALDPRLRTDRPTSLAVAELDANGAASYRFHFAETSAPGLTPAHAIAALPADTTALHVGALGLVLEPMATALEALMDHVGGRALVSLDPNVRPAVIADFDAYRVRMAGVMARADVVKVSDDDLRLLAPEIPPHEAAQALLGRGPKLVLLTLGPAGAVAIGSFGEREVPVPPVSVADTIGAGDVFCGAWLTRWLELGRALDDADAVVDATGFACRAAAWSCTQAGATPPTRADLLAWRP